MSDHVPRSWTIKYLVNHDDKNVWKLCPMAYNIVQTRSIEHT